MAADHSLPPYLQLDREHKVAGLFPRPTFKDKSTYIESSTKVYDDVSVPYSGPLGGSPSTHTSQTRRGAVGGVRGICLPTAGPVHSLWPGSHPPGFRACRVYFLSQVQSSQGHLEIPLVWPARPGVGG